MEGMEKVGVWSVFLGLLWFAYWKSSSFWAFLRGGLRLFREIFGDFQGPSLIL